MRELYILCLEGGLVCPNGRKIRLAQHFGGFFHEIKVASKKEEVSVHAVCRRMRRSERFLYYAAKNFEFFLKILNRSNLKHVSVNVLS